MTSKHGILVPGWATDGQIFDWMTLAFSTTEVVPYSGDFTVDRIVEAVRVAADRLGGPVSVLGFSMGGFLVVESLPRIREWVSEVILVGVRCGYSKTEISQVSENLEAGMTGFLRAFYSAGFPDEVWKSFWPAYSEKWTLAEMQAWLAHLGRLSIAPEDLVLPDRTVLVHGAEDVIASLAEAQFLAEQSGCRMEIRPGGHFVRDIITT